MIRVPVCARVSRVCPGSPGVFLPVTHLSSQIGSAHAVRTHEIGTPDRGVPAVLPHESIHARRSATFLR